MMISFNSDQINSMTYFTSGYFLIYSIDNNLVFFTWEDHSFQVQAIEDTIGSKQAINPFILLGQIISKNFVFAIIRWQLLLGRGNSLPIHCSIFICSKMKTVRYL